MEWLDELRNAAERLEGPTLLTLATLAKDGSPRARMLVVRNIESDGSLLACSDLRSEKNMQIALRSAAEAVLWFEKDRVQFRLRGHCELGDEDDVRRRVWSGMSDRARALFAWPQPKAERAPNDAFLEKVPADEPMPANFEVLRLTPSVVDRLDLSPTPHRRTIWNPADGPPREVNP